MKAKKEPVISFVTVRGGGLGYAENGQLKTYSNIKQAETKAGQLNAAGYSVARTMRWPFVLVQVAPEPAQDQAPVLMYVNR